MTNKRTRYKRNISVRGETAMALRMAHKTGWDEEYFGKSFNSLTHMTDHLINSELDKCGDKSMPKDSDLYYVNQQLKKELKEARQELEAIKAIRVSGSRNETMVMAMVEDHISRYLDRLREEEGLRDVDSTALRLLSNAAEELRKRADMINPLEPRCSHPIQCDLGGHPMPCADPRCYQSGHLYETHCKESNQIIRYVRQTLHETKTIAHHRWILS